MAELNEKLPKINFEVEIDLSHGLLRKLLNATSDIIFLVGPVLSPNVETAPVGNVDLIWTASASLATKKRPSQPPPPLWLLHRHSPIHGLALSSIAEAGFADRTINSCNNVQTLIAIVLAEGGIGFIPKIMVRGHLDRGSLIEIRPDIRRSVTFQAAIRAEERDPLVRNIFRTATQIRIAA